MPDTFKCLDDAIAATKSAAAAGEALQRVLERFRNGQLSVAQLHDATDETTAIMLLAAERMRIAMHEFRSGERRSASGGL
jgi:hypothetical protein